MHGVNCDRIALSKSLRDCKRHNKENSMLLIQTR